MLERLRFAWQSLEAVIRMTLGCAVAWVRRASPIRFVNDAFHPSRASSGNTHRLEW